MKLAARMQKKQWHIYPQDSAADKLAERLRVSFLTAQVLINRQITNLGQAQAFLHPKLTDLIEPERMPNIALAVIRIKKAVTKKEKIAVYGDYDVDGITGVTILWRLLNLLGTPFEYYIPHRIDEGYGLNTEAIKQLADSGSNLIITVDCGICAADSVALASSLGVDMIITDHHQILGTIPEACAVLHPNLDSYPNPDSAGAMVAFKLAWALANEFKKGTQMTSDLRRFLLDATTLAAMGTVADAVDLRGENRILTNYGLKALTESSLAGIKALIESADLTGQNLDSYHIAFRLGPMLNAAGRMGHARLAVELFTSDSQMRCMQIAEYLKQQNRQRRQLEQKIAKHACEMIRQIGLDHPDRKTIVLADDSWHRGVIGIVASRIIDKFYRPTILLHNSNGISSGSARSIEGFDILKAISTCSNHLLSFGGHAMAAGISLRTENVDAFVDAFEQYAAENLDQDSLTSKLEIDALCQIGDLDCGIVRQLQLLEPFGRGNPKPIFATKGVRLISPPRKVGVRGDHLQLSITDSTASVRCIGFGMGKLEKKVLEQDSFNIAYEPQIDTYNGGNSIQFVLSDIQFE